MKVAAIFGAVVILVAIFFALSLMFKNGSESTNHIQPSNQHDSDRVHTNRQAQNGEKPSDPNTQSTETKPKINRSAGGYDFADPTAVAYLEEICRCEACKDWDPTKTNAWKMGYRPTLDGTARNAVLSGYVYDSKGAPGQAYIAVEEAVGFVNPKAQSHQILMSHGPNHDKEGAEWIMLRSVYPDSNGYFEIRDLPYVLLKVEVGGIGELPPMFPEPGKVFRLPPEEKDE